MSPDLSEMLRLGLLGRLVLAAVLGGLIGLERELRAKPAGLRTNLLICMGAALLMEVSISVAGLTHGASPVEGGRALGDPGRIAAQIVSGIGFLGAGTILQARRAVLLATGESKTRCVERVVNGPITTMLPASFLQLHPDAEIFLDADAAKELGAGS